MITGLPAGPYLLRYRRCLTPGGKIAGSAPVASSRVFVSGGHVTTLGSVTVGPPSAGQATGMPMRPAITRFTPEQLRHHFSGQNFGGIAGTVRGPHGRHIKGLCYDIYFPGGFFGAAIGADGRYNSGKTVPPGKYAVGFNAECGSPFGPASANWAPEWYRAKFRLSAANTVVVKAGKITRGIGGVMRPGGVISGRITGHTGRGLGGVCVVAATPKGELVQQVTTPRSGRYRFEGLDPGRYGIGFFPNCGEGSDYLPQWWPGRATETKAGLIRTGFGTTRTHVNARMVLGGTISGVVKFRNRHGHPIGGICVDATPPNGSFAFDFFAATNTKGEYSIGGLPAGRYSVNFSPGCDNNGNYLSQSYPRNVAVRLARLTGNINAYLQPGAIVTGTVTAKSTGAKLAGVCVTTSDGFAFSETGSDGTYSMNQIVPGKIQIEFFNCDNRGNFAPQFYPDTPNAAGAATIQVRAGQVVPGIDAALLPGATISGTISLASGRKLANKLSHVCAEAIPIDFSNSLGGGFAASARGRYAMENMAPGLYQVLYSSCGGPNIADAWFKGPGHSTGDQAQADQIDVPAGGLIPGIDAVLQLGGSISGVIHGPSNQQGSFVCIEISNARTGEFGFINGFPLQVGDGYTIFGFAPGRYLVEFDPCGGENLAFQWYNRAPRPARATPVLVRAGHTTRNVNAWMTAGGTVDGRVVSKASDRPLRGVCVAAISVNQPFFDFGGTNRPGDYVVTGLNASTYRLYFSSCGKSRLVPLVTRTLKVTAGKRVAGPQVAMRTFRPGAISGRVTAAGSPRTPATGVCVDAIPLTGGFLGVLKEGSGTAGPGGYYRITGLLPGKYKVLIGDPNCDTDPGGLVPQWYLNTSRRSKATVVSVAPGRTTRRISGTLQRDGSISGTVTGPKPANKPLAGICVQAVRVGSGETPFLSESVASHGSYLIGELPPGKYLVEFEAHCATTGFATQWWQGATGKNGATPVTVLPGQARTGINASMTPAS